MPREICTLAEGLTFGEGPRWRADDRGGRLWFSDFFSQTIRSVGMDGEVVVELELDDRPSGLGWMPDDSLLFVAMNSREVRRRLPDGRISVHADLSGVAQHTCNDMVVDAQGGAWVGNFGVDFAELMERSFADVAANPPLADLARVSADGSVSVAASDMAFANGSVITPDGKTLIVAESLARRLTAFDIAADGSLSNRRTWAETTLRSPDGIALDAEGAVWFANAFAGECVRIAQGGEVLEVIETGDRNCYACMLGGPEGRHLFMLVADNVEPGDGVLPGGAILVTEVDTPHAGRP
jgi:sugar lactone lactonase YvrE